MSNIPTKWPVVNADVGNPWHPNLSEFVAILGRHEGFWTMDYALKYLNIRVDTRSGHFVLMDRDDNRISADSVLDAINKYRNSFPSMFDENGKK